MLSSGILSPGRFVSMTVLLGSSLIIVDIGTEPLLIEYDGGSKGLFGRESPDKTRELLSYESGEGESIIISLGQKKVGKEHTVIRGM